MQYVILLAQYSVRPCSLVTALRPDPTTVIFIKMSGFSELMWFLHSVDSGLSTQPSPAIVEYFTEG